MNIRDFAHADRDTFFTLSRAFYHTDATDHDIPEAYREKTFALAVEKSPYVRGLLLEEGGAPAGYALLSLSHTCEYGGLLVLLEELYVDPAFQGRGLGRAFFDWLFTEYREAAAFRLDVTAENEGAIRLYGRQGFQFLPYRCMVKPN